MYDLTRLSPIDFETLARDLLQAEWGQRLEVFKAGRDQGIDLRYSRPHGTATIIQCKHYAGSGLEALRRHLTKTEIEKLRPLAPDRYVLFTSVPLSPGNKRDIRADLHPYVIDDLDIIGAGDIENLLARHPTVETNTPKLWLTSTPVMERVFHAAERLQTQLEVERIYRKLSLYVQNAAYGRALGILENEGSVIISGVPGVGKTTLADMLLLAHLEKDFEPVVIRSDMSEARKFFSSGKKQIFYFDDFLGQTMLGPRSDLVGRRQDEAILEFVELAGRTPNTRFVLTTREHLLQQAMQASERLRRENGLMKLIRCVLKVGDYPLLERGRILFNHVYFGDLRQEHKDELLADEFYLDVLQHPNFNPRLIEWMSQFRNIRHSAAGGYRATVAAVLDQPALIWQPAFENQISEAGRGILLSLYSLGGSASLPYLEEAWEPLHRHRSARYNFTSSAEDWQKALAELEGGFLSFIDGRATFVNPSVRDFFDETLCAHPEHARDLLTAAQRFRTVLGIWRLAAGDRGGRLLGYLARQPGLLEDAVERTWGLADKADRGGPAAIGVDVSKAITWEGRFLEIIRMASKTSSTRLRGIAGGFLPLTEERWKRFSPAYEEMLAALDVMEANAPFWSPFSSALRSRLIQQIADEPRSLDGFHAFAMHCERSRVPLGEIETAALQQAFDAYLKDFLDQEIGQIDDEGDLDLMDSRLSEIEAWAGRELDDERSAVQSRIQGLRDNERVDEQRPTSTWSPSPPVSKDGALTEVRNMFGALRPDA
ncbi:restriction endonuclease [Pararoseomonas indoligenes]|uniref:Restriction endonuclease n=1 Tax=Roseomonas indoligenes TaxID=2820811 RepID=A0A940N4D3_9PROT|nr:restriction endonuclease [Pararoseomonas indoligenes]